MIGGLWFGISVHLNSIYVGQQKKKGKKRKKKQYNVLLFGLLICENKCNVL